MLWLTPLPAAYSTQRLISRPTAHLTPPLAANFSHSHASPRLPRSSPRMALHKSRRPKLALTRCGLLEDLTERAAAANAEALAVREGRDLIGKKRGMQTMQAVPAEVAAAKAEACAKLLSGLGCLQLGGALSDATAEARERPIQRASAC